MGIGVNHQVIVWEVIVDAGLICMASHVAFLIHIDGTVPLNLYFALSSFEFRNVIVRDRLVWSDEFILRGVLLALGIVIF